MTQRGTAPSVEEASERARSAARLNAFVELLDDDPSTGEGPLSGFPVAVKDMFVDRDRVPTMGSRVPAHWLTGTATIYERLRAAGATVIGYTNLHEYGLGMTSVTTATGPVRNPWDMTRCTGGSSGGSAAAVAAGIVPLAVGTDAGGSIRCPAALCRVVGLKPTWNAVPMHGFGLGEGAIDHIGPIARDVATARTGFEVLSGSRCEDVDVSRLRVGVARGYWQDMSDPAVVDAVEGAVETLRPLVAEIKDVALDEGVYAGWAVGWLLLPWTARYLAEDLRSRPDDFDPAILTLLRVGREVVESDDVCDHDHADLITFLRKVTSTKTQLGFPELPDAVKRPMQRHIYNVRQGEVARDRVIEAFGRLFGEVDVVVTPTMPAGPPLIEDPHLELPIGRVSTDKAYLPITGPMNLAGVPSLTVPCGEAGGWVASISLTAKKGADEVVLALGEAFEEATERRFVATAPASTMAAS